MKSARPFSEERNCDSHQYCIHQHYQKCKTARKREIAYTIFPKQNLNVSVNLHQKCTNQFSFNFDTLAYEKFIGGKQPETQNDRNFVKNYYLQNVPQKMCMTNQIVQELENEVYPFNAYNLAEGATKDYYAFQYKRKQYLVAAQKRAKINSNQFAKQLKQEHLKNLDERSKWIQKILATLQDLGERMFGLTSSNKENEAQNGKQRIFINEKSYVNEKYLKEFKIQDTEAAKKIFEELRAIMLRKKKKFEDEKIKNRNVELNATQISQNGNQLSAASQSMISAISEAGKEQNEQKIINDLCDFEKLQKKWKTLDVERIKDLILSTLTRKIILNCEGQKAKQISTYKRQCQSIPSKLQAKKDQGKDKKKRSNTMSKKPQNQVKIVYKCKLTKEQSQTKQDLIKSGQFEDVGSRYQKTRNFSNLFKKKQQIMRLDFSFIAPQSNTNAEKIYFLPQTRQSLLKDSQTMKGYKTARTSYLRI